ncbi:putative tRNA pseudouridine synthase Pus10-like protein, partial [Dinothrombium tinctorium]
GFKYDSNAFAVDDTQLNEIFVNFFRENDRKAESIEKECVDIQQRCLKKLEPNYCCSCLGLLQPPSHCSLIETVLKHIKNSNHTFNDFKLNVSLPVIFTLRNEILVSKLKETLKLVGIDKTDFKEIYSVKDIWKHTLSKQISEKFDAKYLPESAFQVTVSVSHEDTDAECAAFFNLTAATSKLNKQFYMNKKRFNHTSVRKAIEATTENELSKLTIDSPIASCKIANIECVFNSLYVVGRYNKYSRDLSQTPWIVDESKFSACGREDVDVRMLGRGRPFVVELIEPQNVNITDDILRSVEESINKSTTDIAVRDVQLSTKDEVNHNLKQGETSKKKEYSALCCFDRPVSDEDLRKISNIAKIEIQQKTPIRVLHRRSLVTRKRMVYKASAKQEDARIVRINLLTEAGTYVKEFVHSDFGRTEPSLATIVGSCKTDIIELDVLVIFVAVSNALLKLILQDIHFDWPPIRK